MLRGAEGIDEGLDERYFSTADHLAMKRMCLRAIKANRALKRSWGNRPAPGTDDRPSRHPRPKHP